MQHERITDGMRRAYDANALNVPPSQGVPLGDAISTTILAEPPKIADQVRQTAGERLADRIAYLADRSALMRERAMDKLLPLIRTLTEEERMFKPEEAPPSDDDLPPFFRELDGLLSSIETNLLVTTDAIEAVDV